MIVAHVGGNEGLAGQVSDPVMELVMMRYDKASLIEIYCMKYKEPNTVSVAVLGKVRRFDTIS